LNQQWTLLPIPTQNPMGRRRPHFLRRSRVAIRVVVMATKDLEPIPWAEPTLSAVSANRVPD
jgi:hypothetical protein